MGRGDSRQRKPLQSASLEAVSPEPLLMISDCSYGPNHYNGYVGDRAWVLKAERRTNCPRCGDEVHVWYIADGQRTRHFALNRATPEQLEDLARATEDYERT